MIKVVKTYWALRVERQGAGGAGSSKTGDQEGGGVSLSGAHRHIECAGAESPAACNSCSGGNGRDCRSFGIIGLVAGGSGSIESGDEGLGIAADFGGFGLTEDPGHRGNRDGGDDADNGDDDEEFNEGEAFFGLGFDQVFHFLGLV